MALKGVKVLDLTRFQNGPYATCLLQDVGADVVKIEQPGVGDVGRGNKTGVIGGSTGYDFSGYNESLNRGKRSIELDLKKPTAKPVMEKLVAWADVLCENYKHGTLERMGWGYEVCKKINPRIIYCSNSGFGPEGEWNERGSFDAICQAFSGAMVDEGGGPSHPPRPAEWGAADSIGAMNFAFHICAALVARNNHPKGEGQLIQCSQLGAMVQFQSINNVGIWNGGRVRDDGKAPFAENVALSYYKCGDGKWLSVAPSAEPRHFPIFCKALGIEHLLTDQRTAQMAQRVRNRQYFRDEVEKKLAENTRDFWVDKISRTGVPAGPVLSHAETRDHPQIRANDYVVEVEHPGYGKITTTGVPARYSGTPVPKVSYAHDLGEDTESILKEVAGMNETEIKNLAATHATTPDPAEGYVAPTWIAKFPWQKPRPKL